MQWVDEYRTGAVATALIAECTQAKLTKASLLFRNSRILIVSSVATAPVLYSPTHPRHGPADDF